MLLSVVLMMLKTQISINNNNIVISSVVTTLALVPYSPPAQTTRTKTRTRAKGYSVSNGTREGGLVEVWSC